MGQKVVLTVFIPTMRTALTFFTTPILQPAGSIGWSVSAFGEKLRGVRVIGK